MKNIHPLAKGRSLLQFFAARISAFFYPLFAKYPRGILTAMFLAVIISAICCFTVLRTPGESPPNYFSKLPSISGQAKAQDNIPAKLQIIMSLRAELQGLEGKDSLSRNDSLRIEKLLSQLAISPH